MEVYYLKSKHVELMKNTEKITLENLTETHVKMPVLFHYTIKTPDEVFAILNDGSSVPNPLTTQKNQQFVRENGTHTSMSIGDIVEIKGIYHMCEDVGWRILQK